VEQEGIPKEGQGSSAFESGDVVERTKDIATRQHEPQLANGVGEQQATKQGRVGEASRDGVEHVAARQAWNKPGVAREGEHHLGHERDVA
jgi:hypothetical protein